MKITKKRGLWKLFGPILGFYNTNSPQNSWSLHFMITLWNLKSRNVRTSLWIIKNISISALSSGVIVLCLFDLGCRFFGLWYWLPYSLKKLKKKYEPLLIMYGIYWPKSFQFLYYQIIAPRKYDNVELARYMLKPLPTNKHDDNWR